jgi:HEAT repeat protein
LCEIVRRHEDHFTDAWYAAAALGQLGGPHSVDCLSAMLRSKSTQDRVAAAEALGQIGDRRAAPDLVALLHNELEPKLHVYADPPVAQSAAAGALARLRDAGTVNALWRAWEETVDTDSFDGSLHGLHLAAESALIEILGVATFYEQQALHTRPP